MTEEVKKLQARTSIRWHESWIVRAAAASAVVLFVGYVASAIYTITIIDTVTTFAYMPDVEQSLAENLTNIKDLHSVQQDLVVERVKSLLGAWKQTGQGTPGKPQVLDWLQTAGASRLTDLQQAKIRAFEGSPADRDLVQWIDREHLRVDSWLIDLPYGSLHGSFKAAEKVKQAYQLAGAQILDVFRPRAIRLHVVTLLATFFVLGGAFVYLAQRVRRRIQDLITGFGVWSESDPNFRFDGSWSGELGLVTENFNAMADEVEINRKKSVYLEKIASWQVIARKLAHEIKNPLTPIQMMVSQLKRRYKGDDPEFSKLLDDAQSIISEEVAGLRRMVDNFSNFARLPQPVLAPINLLEMCRQIVELEKVAFPEHSVNFIPPDAESLIAAADDLLLRQVLINLIKNAAEASSGRKATINVRASRRGESFSIEVEDDGPGISEEVSSRIFEAYVTTKHTGPSPGMGLGLAICQKIILDHGGTISVKSSPGHTTFEIKLPGLRQEPLGAAAKDMSHGRT